MWQSVVVLILVCLLMERTMAQTGSISTINNLTAPYIVGQFGASGIVASTTVSCAATGIDCFLSLQSYGTCKMNVLTLSSFRVTQGTTVVLNLTKSNAVVNTLYEVCLHPNQASTASVGSSYYFLMVPTASLVLGTIPPSNASSAINTRPFVVAPYQARGSLSTTSFAAFQLSVDMTLAAMMSSSITLNAALLPTCDWSPAIQSYVSLNVSLANPIGVGSSLTNNQQTIMATFTYAQLTHLWNMLENNISGTRSSQDNAREGRICFQVSGYQVNGSFTQGNSAAAAAASFPFDLGFSVRLATDFRLAAQRVLRQEDAGRAGAAVNSFYLIAGQTGKTSLLFDHATNVSTSGSGLSADLASLATSRVYQMMITLDLRDPSYPCETFSHEFLLQQNAASLQQSNPNFLPVFASGTFQPATATVDWSVLVDPQFASNYPSSLTGRGAATGLLCVFVQRIPLLTPHLTGTVFTIMAESTSATGVQYVSSVQVAAAFAAGEAAKTMAVVSALQGTGISASFNVSWITPPLSNLRFTTNAGPCAGLSSASASAVTFGIQSTTTRFIDFTGGTWLTGATSFRRICVATVTNTSDTEPYFFSDFSVPLVVVLCRFGGVVATSASRFFVPLNSPRFFLPLVNLFSNTWPYAPSRLQVTFSATPQGCQSLTGNDAVISWTTFGTPGASSFGVGVDLASQISTLAAQFPTGTFSKSDKGVVCIGDTAAITAPSGASFALSSSGAVPTFYEMYFAGYAANTDASLVTIRSTGAPLIALLIDPANGVNISFQVVVRTPTAAALWNVSTVVAALRLSSLAGQCVTGGVGSPMTLSTIWTSVDSSDAVRISASAAMSVGQARSATGVRYLCFSTYPAYITREVGYGMTRFPISIFSVDSINGIDVSLGSNQSLSVVVQFVPQMWVVTGSGFQGVSYIQVTFGDFSAVSLTILNDTTATLSFLPSVVGVQTVNVAGGSSYVYGGMITRNLITMNVIGVQTIGWDGQTYASIFSGMASYVPLIFSSNVNVLPQVCLASSVDSVTSLCTCAPNVNATMTASPSELYIDLRNTSSVSFIGVFPVCLSYAGAQQFFTSKRDIRVLPRPASIGGVPTLNGTDATMNLLRGTEPTVSCVLTTVAPVSLSTVMIALLDVGQNTTLNSGTNCLTLAHDANASLVQVSLSRVTRVAVSTATTFLSGIVPKSVTSNSSLDNRRFCGAIISSNLGLGDAVALSRFFYDFSIILQVGSLSVNNIQVNAASNSTIPVLSQLQTNLSVSLSLPTFVSIASSIVFGIASSSCSDLPLSPTDIVAAQVFTLTNISLTGNLSSSPYLAIPSFSYHSSAVHLCVRWVSGERYSFTNIFLTPVFFDSIDYQSLTLSSDSSYLQATVGVAILKNASRSLLVTGSQLTNCMKLIPLPQLTSDCLALSANIKSGLQISSEIQSFTFGYTQAVDFSAMCLIVYQEISNCDATLTYPVFTLIDAPLSILSFEFFDLYTTTSTAAQDKQQSELLGIIGIDITNTLRNVDSITWSNVTQRPFVQMALFPSTIQRSCDISGLPSQYRFDLVEVAGSTPSYTVTTSFARSTEESSMTVCLLRNPTPTTTWALSTGMIMYVTNISVGTTTLGFNDSVLLTTERAPELSITGANLNQLSLYISVTDSADCATGNHTGVSYVGIERVGVAVSSCSSTTGSVVFRNKPTNITQAPLQLCIAGAPTSSGVHVPTTYYNTYVTVKVLQALKLTPKVQPSGKANADNSISIAPTLAMISANENDSSTNFVQSVPAGITITGAWYYVYPPPTTYAASCDSCTITTTGESFTMTSSTQIRLPDNPKFGFVYALLFNTSSPTIASTLTGPVVRGDCASSQYGELYSSNCPSCPSSAYCTGSMEYTMRKSYWRANDQTDYIYDCGPPYGKSQCQENTKTGQPCLEGHTGPRCTVCTAGYGKSFDQCVVCPPYWESLLTVIGLALGYIILVIFATFSSVNSMDDVRETKHLPMLIKLLTSHLAVASTIGQFSSQFPDYLNTLFDGMQSTSRPSPQFAALDCSLAPTAYQGFLFLILIPIPTLVFVLGGSFFVRVLHYFQDKDLVERKTAADSLKMSIQYEKSKRVGPRQSAVSIHVEPEGSGVVAQSTSIGFGAAQAPIARDGSVGILSPPQSSIVLQNTTRDRSSISVDGQLQPELTAFGFKFAAEQAVSTELLAFDELPVMSDAERDLQEELEDISQFEASIKGRLDTKTLFLLALIVVLLFAYPTLVEQSLNILKCDPIEYGQYEPNGTSTRYFRSDLRNFYFFDRSLLCTTLDHQYYSIVSYASIVVYGVGIPAASIFMIAWFRKNRGADYANRLFIFLVVGYDEDCWWWETVVMWRKLALAFILVFVDDQRLQTYFALWIMMSALGLQLWFEPYDEVNMDRLATASLLVVITTLNFSLLYDYMPRDSPSQSLRIGNAVLTAILFFINAAIILVLVVLVVLHGVMEFQYQISVNQKIIRKFLPKAMQQCLFRFARKPIAMFQKILKKREREKDRKRRIQHVIDDAEGDVVDLVRKSTINEKSKVGSNNNSAKPTPQSVALKPAWSGALSAIGDKRASSEFQKQLEDEKRNSANLRAALKQEEELLQVLMKKYEELLAQQEPSLDPATGDRVRQQAETLRAELQRVIDIQNIALKSAGVPPQGTPQGMPSKFTLSPISPPLPPMHTGGDIGVAHAVPQLVIEDLTAEVSMVDPRRVHEIHEWTPSYHVDVVGSANLPTSKFEAASVNSRSKVSDLLSAYGIGASPRTKQKTHLRPEVQHAASSVSSSAADESTFDPMWSLADNNSGEESISALGGTRVTKLRQRKQ